MTEAKCSNEQNSGHGRDWAQSNQKIGATDMVIREVKLLEKSGGNSGTWVAEK
jgi:hypothetical protein